MAQPKQLYIQGPTFVWFARGIGITGERYFHDGTPEASVITLEFFTPAGRRNANPKHPTARPTTIRDRHSPA